MVRPPWTLGFGGLCCHHHVLAVLLYGSVAQGRENEYSDVDLLILTESKQLLKRQEVVEGMVIEYLEIHESFLKDFIEKDELPILLALSQGKILLDRSPQLLDYIALCQSKIKRGPEKGKLVDVAYQTYIRSKLTEMYKDLQGLEGITFNMMLYEMIQLGLPIFYTQKGRWLPHVKERLSDLETISPKAHGLLVKMLDQSFEKTERLGLTKNFVHLILDVYGGFIEGDYVVFKKTSLK